MNTDRLPQLTLVPPMEPIPFPGDFYLQFQKELAASGQIAHLANTLAHVHWLYEGWTGLPQPLDGATHAIYQKAACWAVRNCSEPDRQVAKNRAVRWGQHAFTALAQQIASCDTPEAAKDDLVRAFITACLDIQRYALMHGVTNLSPHEQARLLHLEDEP